jgi:hypothetical protein
MTCHGHRHILCLRTEHNCHRKVGTECGHFDQIGNFRFEGSVSFIYIRLLYDAYVRGSWSLAVLVVCARINQRLIGCRLHGVSQPEYQLQRMQHQNEAGAGTAVNGRCAVDQATRIFIATGHAALTDGFSSYETTPR